MFKRSLEFFANRFHYKQTNAWLAYRAGMTLVLPQGRRSGKCLTMKTLVQTTEGIKEIKDILPGDYVYSPKGKPIKVLDVIDRGQQEVWDLCSHKRVLATATLDHRWSTIRKEKDKTYEKIQSTKEITKAFLVKTKYYDFKIGSINEPHAYALGALLSNGCRTDRGTLIYISHHDEGVVSKVASILNLPYRKGGGESFTWAIGNKHEKPYCSHYDDWCRGKYSHQKYTDLSVVKKWNRNSLLAFVAGVLDCDGSVVFTGKEIDVSFGMQSKSTIEAIQYAFLALWQYQAAIIIDNREKYKNGPVYEINIKNIMFCKRMLKELDSHLIRPRNKYREEYDSLIPNNSCDYGVGVKLKNPRIEHCYDIEVDSKDHLYLLANGMVSHNSDFFAEVLIEDVETHGKPCLYLASTQESAREIMWPKLRQRLQQNKDWKLQDSNLEAVYKPTETPIRFRGVEKVDNLAGKAYRIVVCDEFALWKRDPDLIVKQILAPMIADFDGLIMYGSSKRGKNHFYDLHEKAKLDTDKYFVQESTIFDNTYISESGRSKIVSEYSGVDDPLYRQEILNEYVTFQGMVFALDTSIYVNKRIQPGDMDHAMHIRGVDHGFSPDPTACVWLCYNEKYGYWQVYSEYKKEALLIHQHAEVINNQEPYEIFETKSDIDPQLIAEYADIGLEMQPAGKFDKQARLLMLVNALKVGRLKIADNCTMLLKEMASYEWDQDGNDHLIDALVYAYTNATLEKAKKEEEDEPIRSRRMDDRLQDFG